MITAAAVYCNKITTHFYVLPTLPASGCDAHTRDCEETHTASAEARKAGLAVKVIATDLIGLVNGADTVVRETANYTIP